MSIIPVLSLLGLVSVAADPPKYPADITKWTEVSIPKRTTKEYEDFLHAANYSKYEWVVSAESGRVIAKSREDTKRKEPLPDFPLNAKEIRSDLRNAATNVIALEDGWFVAYNKGEFGAAIWWFSKDGKQKHKVSSHHVNQFIRRDKEVFAVTGLAHLSDDYGSLIRFAKEDGKWIAKTFANLRQSGCAAVLLPSKVFLVVTGDKLLRISKEAEIETVISHGDWGQLYPNSLAVDDSKLVYIGMRQFVAVYDPRKKDESFKLMVPEKSFLNTEK
jgi:hypothetical protein